MVLYLTLTLTLCLSHFVRFSFLATPGYAALRDFVCLFHTHDLSVFRAFLSHFVRFSLAFGFARLCRLA